MTTVLQSLGTVFAAATANNSSETTSKIIDTSKSIAQVSESSQLRSSSQNVVQSSSTSQKKKVRRALVQIRQVSRSCKVHHCRRLMILD